MIRLSANSFTKNSESLIKNLFIESHQNQFIILLFIFIFVRFGDYIKEVGVSENQVTFLLPYFTIAVMGQSLNVTKFLQPLLGELFKYKIIRYKGTICILKKKII